MTIPLFRRLLGPAIDTLPPTLRAAHDGADDQRWTGSADVTAATHPLARLLCRMMRLPAPGHGVPVSVVFERRGDAEVWRRDFAGRRYRSVLRERNGLMIERMGPATNVFRVSASGSSLRLDLVGFRFLGIPLPARIRPHCHAAEREEDGRYVFDVPVTLPWLGFVIRYTGGMDRHHD